VQSEVSPTVSSESLDELEDISPSTVNVEETLRRAGSCQSLGEASVTKRSAMELI
jgi:hypothetical protein